MDKNAIKKYAVWARRELIERVSQRAMIYGITAKDVGDPNAESVNGHLLSQAEKRQRQALIRNIKTNGYEQMMEEVAYTWFNRFAALRFMEVNGYLPSHIRVFTNDAGEFKPQILAEAIHLELDGLDMNKVYELESANKSEELFKYLLIVQCNALNSILPGMFQRIEDYTELLLPDYLLREGSVIEQMVTTIPEEDWTDQVQIIGWLYQYYNTEPKAAVFAKKGNVSKNEIPAATQLFTPDWIVHYMVENSLGRLWLEGHPNDALKSEWKYYLDEAEQEPDVQARLATIRKEYAALKPEEIRVIDPCMGSGHILSVLFDVLVRIYEDYGYTAREAAVKIVENNLWGLDIDERAAQLSYFAVMMKARQYDRRFFARKVQPHVYAIHETNALREDYQHARGDFRLSSDDQETLSYLFDAFVDAKEYGSILQLQNRNYEDLKRHWEQGNDSQNGDGFTLSLWYASIAPEVSPLIDQAIALTQDYHIVVTNPPYMGSRNGMNNHLCDYVNSVYPDGKADLYSVFIERCGQMTGNNGFYAMITQHGWMFLTSFAKLRKKVLFNTIINLLHLGPRAFDEISGEVVQSSSFVIRKANIGDYLAPYSRLISGSSEREKESLFFAHDNDYYVAQREFSKLEEEQIAYWLSNSMFSAFDHKSLGDYAKPRQGMATSDNNRFLRLWHEVQWDKVCLGAKDEVEAEKSRAKWFPYNKGGGFRKWYGNNDYLINWEYNGAEVKELAVKLYKCVTRTIKNIQFYFKPGVTWSTLSSGSFNARYCSSGFLFDTKGSTCYFDSEESIPYFTAFLNSSVANELLKVLAPTLDYNAGSIAKLPVILAPDQEEKIRMLFWECVRIAKEDWDSFEDSWDFMDHPLVVSANRARQSARALTIARAYEEWNQTAEERFQRLKENEEELNRRFIAIYHLDDELSPLVEKRDITVRKADLQRDVRSLISYAVGCIFGRYSLSKPGLAFAGGLWDDTLYTYFKPDKDAIVPICDDEYFEDDIVGRFVKFIETAYGKDTLEENLRFIADALGGKGSSREVIRSYFINDFYTDHLKVYQKRPIYWLFDSGKKNGFKCLIYMHRYQPDTIARIRTDYVHEQQSRYRTAIADLEQRINGASTSERVKLSKQLATLQAQAEEIRVYEEKIHHLADQMIKIDLNDGVKHNYEIFKDVLAKIK